MVIHNRKLKAIKTSIVISDLNEYYTFEIYYWVIKHLNKARMIRLWECEKA